LTISPVGDLLRPHSLPHRRRPEARRRAGRGSARGALRRRGPAGV